MQAKLVKLLDQCPLVQRTWQRPDQSQAVISSVDLKLTDGINTFYAEVTDQMAININSNRLMLNATYAIQYIIVAREWENQNHERMHSNTIRITRINQFYQ